jgi:predicted RNase H-like nuclease (RuvC/YqgF family)
MVERIRREAAQPLEARIANLEGEIRRTRDRCSEVTAKNHRLYQDVQDLEDDLDDARRECASLCEKTRGSHHRDPDNEPPSKRMKRKGRAVPTPSSSHLPPSVSQVAPMVVD